MAFFRTCRLACIILFAIGASSSDLGRLRHGLRRISAASTFLKDVAEDTFTRAEHIYCADGERSPGFLQGIGNPLCRWDRPYFNPTPSREQIESEMVEADLALKVWRCVLEPVLEEMEDEVDVRNAAATIPERVDWVQSMIESMGLTQAFQDVPCNLVLLQAFKRHTKSFRDQVSIMLTNARPHGQ